MSRPAIVVENLSKKFRIGTGGSPGYHRLSEMLTGLPRYAYNKLRPSRPALDPGSPHPASRRGAGGEGLTSEPSFLPPSASSLTPASDFWALRDVSFEVQPGEVVGIIGRNGAGKSTLLKILSRITEPTSGRFGVRGRVASLLEVGTGFHPELTGRENIYVSGVTLGMTRAEIKKRFDEIVDFSGVEKFLDTPVKHYSSGMQVRLGFAVAAHLESEILIIDEVLAVGDAEFQKKCLGKMEWMAQSGRTVIFVSHSMNALRRTCSSAALLQAGRLPSPLTSVDIAIENYLKQDTGDILSQWVTHTKAQTHQIFTLHRMAWIDEDDQPCRASRQTNTPGRVRLEGEIHHSNTAFNAGYAIYSETNELLYWSLTTDLPENETRPIPAGRAVFTSELPARFLNNGRYRIEAIASIHMQEWILQPGVNAPSIEISISGTLSESPFWTERRPGLVAPHCPWMITKASSDLKQEASFNRTGD